MAFETDLTSISTHGWFVEPTIDSQLEAISTYGWFYSITVSPSVGNPDILYLLLCLNTQVNFEFER